MKQLIKYTGILAVIFLLTGCLKEDDLNLELTTIVPVEINDGIVISSPNDENINAENLGCNRSFFFGHKLHINFSSIRSFENRETPSL